MASACTRLWHTLTSTRPACLLAKLGVDVGLEKLVQVQETPHSFLAAKWHCRLLLKKRLVVLRLHTAAAAMWRAGKWAAG